MTLYLGAIKKDTKEYIYPKIGNKYDEYLCPECNNDLIFVDGKIRKKHFRHKINKKNPCTYYDHPNESQIHKDAKFLLKKIIDEKYDVNIVRHCDKCNEKNNYEIIINDMYNVELEYRFNYNGTKIADVACIEKDKIKYIFEICNTHRTDENDRPEPWFEIDAKKFIENVNGISAKCIDMDCIRNINCDKCTKKEKRKKKNKKKAKKLVISWLNEKIKNGDLEFNKFYASECEIYDDPDFICDGYCDDIYDFADIIIFHKSNIKYIFNIGISEDIISKKYKKICDDYGICIGIIDIEWIFDQKEIPLELNFVDEHGDFLMRQPICPRCKELYPKWISESNVITTICKQCDIQCYNKIYFEVSYSSKEEFKNLGGKFDGSLKKWYIDNDNKNYNVVVKRWKEYSLKKL